MVLSPSMEWRGASGRAVCSSVPQDNVRVVSAIWSTNRTRPIVNQREVRLATPAGPSAAARTPFWAVLGAAGG